MSVVIECLSDQNRSDFDCGETSLDNFLKLTAKKSQKKGGCRAFVAVEDNNVHGYYSISAASVAFVELPTPIRQLDSSYPVPAVLFGRWAVDKRSQGNGIGMRLLIDAMQRTVRISDDLGVALFIVDPINETVRQQYIRKFGFLRLNSTSGRLFLPISTLRTLISGS